MIPNLTSGLRTSDTVQEFKAVISKDSTLVNLREFIELVTPYDQVHAAAAPILVELVTPYDQVHAAAAPILVELVTPYDQVHAAAAPILVELVTPYDQVHAAAALILVELTCCITLLEAVWTSSSYFQHFFWHHTLSCSGLPLMVSHCSMNKTVPC